MVCGRCRHCMAGQRHLCAHSIGLGVGRDGAFAEYVALPMANVWHHWPGIDEDDRGHPRPCGKPLAPPSASRSWARTSW